MSWLVKTASEPYDVVAVYTGNWDASFTTRNLTGFTESLEGEIDLLIRAWPAVHVILFTLTPCGGSLKNTTSSTPTEACAWVHRINEVFRNVAARHAPATSLLDAYQMTRSRPGSDRAGYPPGIWLKQQQGWHFELTTSLRALEAARQQTPPSAAGEMNRAFANRIFDVMCPHTSPAALHGVAVDT